MRKSLITVKLLIFFSICSWGQSAAELRAQFFLEAMKNPERIKELVNGYAAFEGNEEMKTLYEIYKVTGSRINFLDSARQAIHKWLGEPTTRKQKEKLKLELRKAENNFFRKNVVYSLNIDDYNAYYLWGAIVTCRFKNQSAFTADERSRLDRFIYQVYDKLEYARRSNLSYTSRMSPTKRAEYLGNSKVNYPEVYREFIKLILTYNYSLIDNEPGIDELETTDAAISIENFDWIAPEKEGSDLGRLDHYFAFIFTDSKNLPHLIEIPGGQKLNDRYLKDHFRIYGDFAYNADVSDYKTYERYWRPFEPFLKGKSTVYLKASGVYNQLNHEDIHVKANDYLGDFLTIKPIFRLSHFNLKRVSSKRKLRFPNTYMLFGNPSVYTREKKKKGSRKRSKQLNWAEEVLFNWVQNDTAKVAPQIVIDTDAKAQEQLALPYSELEVRVLARLLTLHGYTGQIYLNEEATESRLKENNAAILHISAHSNYFREDIKRRDYLAEKTIISFEPRSAIFLSGGQTSLNELRSYKRDSLRLQREKQKLDRKNDILDVDPIVYEVQRSKSFWFGLLKGVIRKKTQRRNIDAIVQKKYKVNREKRDALDRKERDWDNGISVNDGLLLPAERITLKNTDLLTIASCGPQNTELNYQIGPIDRRSHFSPNREADLVAPLWPVNDEAATLFILKFYKFLLEGDSKNESLKKAKRSLRNIPEFNHPHFWAGWTLYKRS